MIPNGTSRVRVEFVIHVRFRRRGRGIRRRLREHWWVCGHLPLLARFSCFWDGIAS